MSVGGLGDFLSRWPLWQSLRRTFPDARISCLGLPRHTALLRAAGLCDDTPDFEAASWSRPGALGGRFDLVVSVLGERGRGWIGRACGGSPPRLIEIEPFPPAGGRVSVSGHILAQALAAGLEEPGPSRIPLPPGAAGRAREWFAARGLEEGQTAAIHPGSGSRGKNWPAERFARLAGELARRGLGIIAIGGEAEEEALPGAVPCRGTDLVTLAAILARCACYAGNDSGVSHLAALTGIPAAVIFGPTDPAVWAPRGERVAVIRRPVSCAPCGDRERAACAHKRCLEGIGVGEVLAAMLQDR
ncbi:MAG: glycosyltransferase family 9 protein [bacterium]|nr:glycosyltransferase family 9 protein [bacterium]